MVATTFTETEAGKTPQGGVMLCHLKGCECFATWAVPQLGGDRESLVLPDERELAEMREALQG